MNKFGQYSDKENRGPSRGASAASAAAGGASGGGAIGASAEDYTNYISASHIEEEGELNI